MQVHADDLASFSECVPLATQLVDRDVTAGCTRLQSWAPFALFMEIH